MAEPTPEERSVRGRGLEDRGLPSHPGNPGRYLGGVEVGGRRYAKFGADSGTWVSSSMRTMGYDQVYPATDGFGAYRGLVLDLNGRLLADPDRIRPGDQYLVPERGPQSAPPRETSTAPFSGVPAARATPPVTGWGDPAEEHSRPILPNATPAPPRRLNLRPAAEVEPLSARHGQQSTPDEDVDLDSPDDDDVDLDPTQRDDVDLDPTQRDELERLFNDPSSEDSIVDELRHLALDGIDEALTGRTEQDEFSNYYAPNRVEGALAGDISFLNDWVSSRRVPYIGSWHNTAMLFRRMLEQVEAGELDDALLTGSTARASLADTQAVWNDYTRANLRLGDLMTGTADEIRATGAANNLRLAEAGLVGGMFGASRRISEIVASVFVMLADPLRATPEFLKSLAKVVDAAIQLVQAYGQDPADFLPRIINVLSNHSVESLERLSKLPPDKQARVVGEMFGEIEGDLVAMKAANSISASLQAEALSVGDFGNARFLEGMRGLVPAGGPTVVVADTPAATLAAADAMPPWLLSASAFAAGKARGGRNGPKEEVVHGEVTDMEDYRKRGHNKGLEAHEVLMHSLLEDFGVAKRRGFGLASRKNPVIALSREVHVIVGRYQRALKVMYRLQRKGKTPRRIILENLRALRYAGVPESVVQDISRRALRHAMDLKIIPRSP